MTLDRACEPTPLRPADDVNDVAVSELIHQNLIAHVGGVVRGFQAKLFQHRSRRNAAAGFLEMTAHRIVDVLYSDRTIFDQTNLLRIVTVASACSIFLHNDTLPRLNNSYRGHRPVRPD